MDFIHINAKNFSQYLGLESMMGNADHTKFWNLILHCAQLILHDFHEGILLNVDVKGYLINKLEAN